MEKIRYTSIALAIGLLTLLVAPNLLVTVTADPPDPTPQPVEDRPTGDPLTLIGPLAYPTDPTADTAWWPADAFSGVADIQTAFNNARAAENTQLGTSIPTLTLPSQAEWDAKSNGEKALWLINRERIDRGVHPLHGLETNVTSVAQDYAEYLIDNDAFGHYADGRSPGERLDDNPAIGACHDSLPVAENLTVIVTSGTSIPLPVERAVYMWMYKDSDSSWVHRHTILWYPYTENSGPVDKEGFLGIGRAGGGPYQGPFSEVWNYAEIIVMDVFDPCATWDYEAVLGNLPDALQFTYSIPDQRLLPTSHQVTPENGSSDETLTWSITFMGAWFTVSPLGSTTPNSFWITPTTFVTTTVMTYTGAVTVTVTNPTGVEGSPHLIDLTLRIVNSPFSHVHLPLIVKSYAP